MAATGTWFTLGLAGLMSATSTRQVNWTGDTIDVALLTASASPNRDTWEFYTDLTNEVANGNGYTTGGVALASKSTSTDASTHEARFLAGNSQWTSATFSFRYAVVYKNTGSGATSPLLGYVDFGGTQTVSSGTAEIDWDATLGVLYLQAS